MARRQRAVLIAVTGPDRGGWAPRALVNLALWLAGARTLNLRPSQPHAEVEPDGVVITGGHDIDPVLYASAPEVQPRHDRARDALELAVIDQALARNVPILGICRGAQLLNVRLGGSLFQELRSRRHHTSNRWTLLPLKTLCVEEGSWLRGHFSRARERINSLHNQGIDRLGDGLEVAGRDLDGIVQAIEAPERSFVIGVQWHPEFLLYRAGQRRLFSALVEAARQHSAR